LADVYINREIRYLTLEKFYKTLSLMPPLMLIKAKADTQEDKKS
jgi:hypothetical protein